MKLLQAKQFSSKLAGVIRSAKTQRDAIQALIESGLAQYCLEGSDGKPCGNTGQLTQVIQACVGVKSLPTNTIKNYIKEHANVMFTKNKKGEYVFKKLGKEVQVTEPKETWYNWSGNKEAKPQPDIKLIARTKAMLTAIKKGIEEDKLEDVSGEMAHELESFMEKWVQKASKKDNVLSVKVAADPKDLDVKPVPAH